MPLRGWAGGQQWKLNADGSFNALSWKQPVRLASTVAGNLAVDFAAGQVLDGVVIALGDDLLIKDQADAREKGRGFIQIEVEYS